MWGVLVERTLFTVRRATLPVLPAGSPDLKVLHLSDLHMAPWQRKKQRFVRELADLEPDLVVDTGDNLGHPLGLLGLRAALEPFRGVPGVQVHGSNDYWAPVFKSPLRYFAGPSAEPPMPRRLNTPALDAFFADLGWTDLNNRVARLVVKGVPLDLMGVNDPHREYDRVGELTSGLRGLRARKERAALTIGVAHAPYRRVLDDFTERGADLLFAGHTHGGQVCVPGFGALVTNCDIPRKQVKGVSEWRTATRSATLNVSAGLGTSIYAPVRFACRPEVSLLTLTAAA
ncbi:MAG TPA: metallophosphoesterase [Amnibacterium sp.]|nr:metallophosphoesterase [Amnibacterium sp.]